MYFISDHSNVVRLWYYSVMVVMVATLCLQMLHVRSDLRTFSMCLEPQKQKQNPLNQVYQSEHRSDSF